MLFNASSSSSSSSSGGGSGGRVTTSAPVWTAEGGSKRERERERERERRERSRPFVLVASDAVGMGLNLTIRRIIFSSLEKYDGTRRRLLHSAVSKAYSGLVQARIHAM